MSRFLHPSTPGWRRTPRGSSPGTGSTSNSTPTSPLPPAPAVLAALTEQDLADLRLYSDPEGTALRAKLAELYGWSRGRSSSPTGRTIF